MLRARAFFWLAAIAALAAHARPTSACQLTLQPPLSAFDESWYVLIGEVTEIAGPVASDEVVGGAFGLRVRVTERLYSPEPVTALVEVFEYNLSAACEALGIARDDLARAYPPGTAVRIVARAAARLPRSAGDGIRLEAGPFNAHVLVGPIYRDEPLSASLTGIYDFDTPLDVDRYERIDATRFNWVWYEGLVEFELVKELLRLESARGDAGRTPILRRIGRNPLRREIDFPALVARYIEDANAAARLISEIR
jgi:hypothetical protein